MTVSFEYKVLDGLYPAVEHYTDWDVQLLFRWQNLLKAL